MHLGKKKILMYNIKGLSHVKKPACMLSSMCINLIAIARSNHCVVVVNLSIHSGYMHHAKQWLEVDS